MLARHIASSSPGGVRLHYARGLNARDWEQRHAAGEVPDRWPYGLHRLADATEVAPAIGRESVVVRGLRKVAGGYDWQRMASSGSAAVCWDERTGVPVALSGVPTLTGVIWLTEPGHRHWTDRVARRALSRSTVFVLSPRQLTDLHDRWGVPPERAHFVPFGVDEEFWHPVDGENDGVLTVGNDRHRDHPLAVRAAASTGHRLTVVTSQDLPVPRVPFLSHPELRQAYADHRVVAVATTPNRHGSGMTVVLEAMACGRPVVATRGGGLESYVTPETGVLVPAGDEDAMARALQDLLADPDRSVAMGRAGRAAVLERFTTGAMAARLRDLMEAL